jgi:hypothetical protein
MALVEELARLDEITARYREVIVELRLLLDDLNMPWTYRSIMTVTGEPAANHS